MAYTTVSDVRAASGLSDSDKISDAFITNIITQADSIIDSEIRMIYAMPLSYTPPVLASASLEMTVGLLYQKAYGEESQDTDKGWKKHVDFAVDVIDKIYQQKIALLDDNGDELARSTLRQPASNFTDVNSVEGEMNAPRITTLDEY
jgi:phage gp36-like protein